jgi:hypothetical protein
MKMVNGGKHGSGVEIDSNRERPAAARAHNLPKQPKTQGLYSASTSQIITSKLKE